MSKQYFKTIVQVEILSADAPWNGNLSSLSDDVTDGDFSGKLFEPIVTKLSESEMATALIEQGSSPEFLINNDDDEDDENNDESDGDANDPDYYDMRQWDQIEENWYYQRIGDTEVHLKRDPSREWGISQKSGSGDLTCTPDYEKIFGNALTVAEEIIENLQKEQEKLIRDI